MKRGHRQSSDDETSGMIAVCMCGTLAILINSFFDPTLEGAQVAVVMYLLVGIGVALVRQPLNTSPETVPSHRIGQKALLHPATQRRLQQLPRIV